MPNASCRSRPARQVKTVGDRFNVHVCHVRFLGVSLAQMRARVCVCVGGGGGGVRGPVPAPVHACTCLIGVSVELHGC